MNAQYKPTSGMSNSAIAVLACIATVTVLGSISGLAEVYASQAQLASAKPVVVVQR